MKQLKRFKIKGLFGNRNIDLVPRGGAMILVGPNGIGKSSVINVLYFFISRQWRRLLEYKFDEISLELPNQTIQAKREDITGLSDLGKIMSSLSSSPRVRGYVEKLQSASLLEEFLTLQALTPVHRRTYASLLDMPIAEVPSFQSWLRRKYSSDEGELFTTPRINLEKTLADAFPSRTLYLPTYRRIEKDLREIFPDFEEKYRTHTAAEGIFRSGRSSSHYIDLVSFGMEDVRMNFEKRTRGMRDYSLVQYNNLSAVYLRDVIRGTADKFAPRDLDNLTDDRISQILSRVDETTLTAEDKKLVLEKVRSIQGKTDIVVNDRFLAHYFTRLVHTNADIARKELDIKAFVEVCNAYLAPEKRMVYDEIGFRISILDDRNMEIDLSVLSSGEKQIVSIFSHLYLDETENQIVVIDEPELSLSVPWQKRFLTDIQDSAKCNFIVAVTHSPFIYENRLESSAIDLRRRTTIQ